MIESRDYDLELKDLLKRFEPYNLLIKEHVESNLNEHTQPIVTLRWVDKTTEFGESTDANS